MYQTKQYTCKMCGATMQATSDSSKVTCPECGYIILDEEPTDVNYTYF